MAFTPSEKRLTKENILKHVDSYQLFQAYCKNFSAIDRMFKSEFRKDTRPSCHIIMWEGDLLYKDFGEPQGYRVFDYIARKFNTDFQGALSIINQDFGLGLGSSASIGVNASMETPEKVHFDVKQFERQPTIIEIEPRRWTKLDREYWAQYEIPPLLLKYHKIYSIASYRIDSRFKDNAFYRVNPYQLAYSFEYYWHKGVFRRKLYFPQTKGRYRFITNVNNTIVQGWTLLPKNKQDILFITKSYKDILTFNMLGYWAIAPNNEHSFIPEQVMEKLKKRFSNIYVWFDNDEGGIDGAKGFAEKFNLPFTHNPVGEPKDPSDFVKEYSSKEFDKLVTQFLKNEGHTNYCS
jgi:hypothetical protein